MWVEISAGEWFALESFIAKGASHKYLWRKKMANGKWKYYYNVAHGGGIVNAAAEASVGTAFRMRGEDGKAGHYHVTSDDGSVLTIKHDESGTVRTVSREDLRGMLHRAHASAIVKKRNETLRDLEAARKTGTAKQQAKLEQQAAAVGARISGGAEGRETKVFIAGRDGAPSAQRARYRLVEASEMMPSHDPKRAFAKHPKYPAGVQERAYDRDKTHQETVRDNAQRIHPEFMINTNPDAVNGPPLIAKDGVVLGGNSRTMSLQLAYANHPEAAGRYRSLLAQHASHFGLTAAQVNGMKEPMLVREVEDDGNSHATLVRRYNESFTQGMDPRTAMAAKSRLVNKDVTNALASGMDQMVDGEPKHPTLGSFLDSNDSRGFLSALERAGVIDRRNREEYVSRSGKFNEDGKRYVERLLVGSVVDSDVLPSVTTQQMAAIARSIPHLVAIEAAGYGRIKEVLAEALRAQAYMRDNSLKTLSEFERSRSLGDHFKDAGFDAKPELSAEGSGMLDTLLKKTGTVQLSGFFRDAAVRAKRHNAGQPDITGETKTLADILGTQREPEQQGGLFKGRGGRTLRRAVRSILAGLAAA